MRGRAYSLQKVLLISLVFCLGACENQQHKIQEEVSETILTQVDSFYHFLESDFLPYALRADSEENSPGFQKRFLKARLLFKKFEWAGEYFLGGLTSRINGPPVQEVDNADLLTPDYAIPIDPEGLQVIEGYLFPKYQPSKKEQLIREVKELISNTKVFQTYFKERTFKDWRILDAAKLEVFRIISLGLAGFDNPLTLRSSEEAAASLRSLKEILSFYEKDEEDYSLLEKIDHSILYLEKNTSFDSLDRAAFITRFANPITQGITRMASRFGYPVRYNRMLKQDAPTLFDSGIFNLNAFVPGPAYYFTKEKAELGKVLFFDPALSGTGTRSCATCHNPGIGFTDGLTKHTNIHDENKLIKRHTPTLLNVALQSNYFDDMRALTLEDQANDVLHNPEEMDGDMQDIIRYLKKQTTYRNLFTAAYPQKKESVDSVGVLNALASYERSLTYLNSRFDQYMRGDSSALDRQEIKGFNLFMSKAKCGTCHFMPVFNGITPPKYVQSEAEVIGVPKSEKDTVIDPDLGWYNIVGVASYKHAFKTPTVRNASKTAPYMHNGIHKNMEELMEFYNNAGAVGLGIPLPNQTLPEDSLHLSTGETDAVIAFIKSLDSVY